MALADHDLTAIEKTLLKTPATTTGSHDDICSKEQVRSLLIAMASNQAYLGTNRANPFHYQNFNLSQIVVYRKGHTIAGTLVSTHFTHRMYFKTPEALNFLDKVGHGITFDK